jgi:hypothetical protein
MLRRHSGNVPEERSAVIHDRSRRHAVSTPLRLHPLALLRACRTSHDPQKMLLTNARLALRFAHRPDHLGESKEPRASQGFQEAVNLI